MMKKILVLLSVCILTLSGCGSSAGSSPDPGQVSENIPDNDTPVETDQTQNTSDEGNDHFVDRLDDRAVTNTISDDIKAKAAAMPAASYDNLPTWCGTTLYNKYEYGWTGSENMPYSFNEMTVQEISDIGFDFVRVLIDTRYIYSESADKYPAGPEFAGNSEKVNLDELKNIDDLITWCVERNIHVCLDVHNTPGGYMIGGDEEASRELLFTEGSAEEQMFFDYWDLIARRYSDISTNALSYNIYNEPPTFVEDEQYTDFIKKALDIIWAQSDDRLVFVDMLKYAREPVYGLVGEKIVQTFHVYEPYEFSHDNQARLMEVRDGAMPEVTAYPILPVSSLTYAKNSYTIHGDFPAGTTIIIENAMGAAGGTLTVNCDKEADFQKEITDSFIEENGISLHKNEYDENTYNVYDDEMDPIYIEFTTTKDASDIEFTYKSGSGSDSWFEINGLVVETDKTRTYIPAVWVDGVNMPRADITIDPETGMYTLNSKYDDSWTVGLDEMDERIKNFYDFSVETGTPIMMQETGDIVYTDTPSTVRYLDDVISTCEKYDIGWVIYSHDGCEFSYVAIEEQFKRLNGNYEEINPGRYIETNIRDLFIRHINK